MPTAPRESRKIVANGCPRALRSSSLPGKCDNMGLPGIRLLKALDPGMEGLGWGFGRWGLEQNELIWLQI